MTHVVIPAGEDITAHLSGGDHAWLIAVTNSSTGDTVLADTVTEVVEHLIDGYDPSDPEAAFEQRLEWAVQTTNLQQGLLAVVAQNEGTLDIDTIGEDALTALFTGRDEAAEVAQWRHEVPLLHVASHYEPYSERPRPEGNVHLIDPYTELTLLLSLHAAGTLEVLYNDEDRDEGEEFAA